MTFGGGIKIWWGGSLQVRIFPGGGEMSKFSASGNPPIPPERKTLNIYYTTPFWNFNVSIMLLWRSCKIQTSFKTPVFVVVVVVFVFSKKARTCLLTKSW